MPLPSRIKITDIITGGTLGQDGVLRVSEGAYIGFSWIVDGLYTLVQYGKTVFSSDEFRISISINSRQSGAEPIPSDFALEDTLFKSYSSSAKPFFTWSWISQVGTITDTQKAVLDRKIFAVSDYKTEGPELFDLLIRYDLVSENLTGRTSYSEEASLLVEILDASRMQVAVGSNSDDVINFSDYRYGVGRDGNGHLSYLADYYQDKGTPIVTDYPIYAAGGLGADLYLYSSAQDVYKGVKAVSLGKNTLIESGNITGSSFTDDQLFSSSGDDVWSASYVAMYAYRRTVMVGHTNSYTTNLLFPIDGKQRFADVIHSDISTDFVKPLNVYLSNNAGGDAFFLHDTFSTYNKSVQLRTDVTGRQYAPRIAGVDWLFAGNGDDIVDLTTTEDTAELTCNRVDLGDGDDILMGQFNFAYGGNGDDLIIVGDQDTNSGYMPMVNGGPGRDTFAFVSPQGSLRNTSIAKIADFVTGIDSIRLYVDLANSKQAMTHGGHDMFAPECIQRLESGDLSWSYYKYTETWGGVTTLHELKQTISLEGALWSPTDVQILPFTSYLC